MVLVVAADRRLGLRDGCPLLQNGAARVVPIRAPAGVSGGGSLFLHLGLLVRESRVRILVHPPSCIARTRFVGSAQVSGREAGALIGRVGVSWAFGSGRVGALADGAVDFDYLEGYCGGDSQIVVEVLSLFQTQAEAWRAGLESPGEGWRDLVHTIKGAARGVGATRLGEVADRAERGDPSLAPDVQSALADALADIEGYLTRIGGG